MARHPFSIWSCMFPVSLASPVLVHHSVHRLFSLAGIASVSNHFLFAILFGFICLCICYFVFVSIFLSMYLSLNLIGNVQ